ncbi:MAG: carboxylate-amine ligase [Armatimonadetes bacterium]|nr:carboxylate-amine ligase [Armatimonadota bacterium]
MRASFEELQKRLPGIWQALSDDPSLPRTVVAIPSLSIDIAGMGLPEGMIYYEERIFYLFNLLRSPNSHLVLVTSHLVPEYLISYYLHLLPSVPFSHARSRLHLFAASDMTARPLSDKLLERPALVERIRRRIRHPENSYISAYTISRRERELAVQLQIPILGANPEHRELCTKSNSRKLFRRIGVDLPEGMEDLRDESDICEAILELHRQDPALNRVVIKQNETISGMGNAIFPLDALQAAESEGELSRQEALALIRDGLPHLARLGTRELKWDDFMARFQRRGGVVEGFIEGSPCSVQLRIDPLGGVALVSTHDELMGGFDNQTYIGCRFPARQEYRQGLHRCGRAIGEELARAGVLGRIDADFVAILGEGGWKLEAIDINLRKGNTTHPIRTLQFLTGGQYDPDTGVFETQSGERRYYVSSDKLASESFRGLLPEDLIDIATYTGIHYTTSNHTGTVFHMLGGLSELGRLGVTCIEQSYDEAERLYERTREVISQEVNTHDWMI